MTCPVDGALADPIDDDDQWGEDFIPDVGAVSLSVDQFDRADVASMEGVPESDIHLLKAELTISLEVTEMERHLFNLLTPCTFEWSWPVNMTVLANGSVGTPELSTPPIAPSDDSGPLNPGDTYDWTLAADGGGPQTVSACYAALNDLEGWIGNGQIDFDVSQLATPSDMGCANAGEQRFVRGIVVIEVVYTYCVADDTPDPMGCECDRPSPHYRRPGSLLLFPEYDTRPGEYTVLTVTNTDCLADVGGDCLDGAPDNIAVEFVFVDGDDCQENNVTKFLTPCDTLTMIARQVNPTPEQGYVYAFAKEYDGGLPNGRPISYNFLVGNEMIISGFSFFDYSMNPVAFRSFEDPGCPTDIDGDGYRDLDNVEYQPAPNIITIPRFFGQDDVGFDDQPGPWNSQLILIGLTGGQQFDTTACFTFYNDNEEINSSEWTFHCWDKPYLLDISNGFGNSFLQNFTDHDTREIFGAPERETGWICIEGCAAFSDQEDIDAPAIYAALIEHVGELGIADLPFECGIRLNGTLVPRGQFGDPDEDTNGDGEINDDDAVDGDER